MISKSLFKFSKAWLFLIEFSVIVFVTSSETSLIVLVTGSNTFFMSSWKFCSPRLSYNFTAFTWLSNETNSFKFSKSSIFLIEYYICLQKMWMWLCKENVNVIFSYMCNYSFIHTFIRVNQRIFYNYTYQSTCVNNSHMFLNRFRFWSAFNINVFITISDSISTFSYFSKSIYL